MATVPELPDTEPPTSPKEAEPEQPKGKSKRKAFASLRRELNDKELSSPAVQKLLLDEIDRLEDNNIELCGFRGRFYDADKRAAILEEKSKIRVSNEVVSTACITVGAAALGYAPAVWASQPTGFICIVFGLLLVILGIVAKAVKS